jgi:hypothetical protein
MQNVRVGDKLPSGETPLLADLHVKDLDLIDKIDGGIRDVSCGYTYILKRLANGSFIQTNIRGNHMLGNHMLIDCEPCVTSVIFAPHF